MKKLLSVLMVLVLILSACSNPEEPIVEPPESGEPSEDVSSEPEKEFSIDDMDTSEYDEVKDYGFMYVLTKTEGTRIYNQWDEMGLSYLGEEPNEQIWLLSKNGEFLNEEPFQSSVYPFEGNPGEWWVYGIRDGVLYPFYINENTGDFTVEEPWGPRPYEVHGYTIYEYYWSYHNVHYGVLSPDGSDFAEPIYINAQIPCKNRIALINGNLQNINALVCTIYDENKNVINDNFNWIFYNNLSCDDGYIGIAYCGDPENPETIIRYDKNGNIMAEGYYFVDASGNIIEGPFKKPLINDNYMEGTIYSGEDKIKVIYYSGEEKEFLAKEILIKE